MGWHTNETAPAPDKVLTDIADYVLDYTVESELAYATARHCLMDTLGCGLEALEYPACTKLLGPWCRAPPCRRGCGCQVSPAP